MSEITMKLSEDDQAIMHRGLINLARSTENDAFKVDVQALRKRVEVEGKEAEHEPPKLFDKDTWTDHGDALARRVDNAIKHIVEQCRDDGVDLRHATFIMQQQVSTAFLQAHIERYLAKSKKRKEEERKK